MHPSCRILPCERDALAALFGQETQNAIHGSKIRAVDNLPAPSLLLDQPGADQRAKMMRKGREGQAGMCGNVPDNQPLFARSDKQTKDIQPGGVAQGGECPGDIAGVCVLSVHAPNITTYLVMSR